MSIKALLKPPTTTSSPLLITLLLVVLYPFNTNFGKVFVIEAGATVVPGGAEGAHQHSDCISFLERWLPSKDSGLAGSPFLHENVELALAARKLNTFSSDVPWPVFLNEVLSFLIHYTCINKFHNKFHNKFLL